VPGAWFNGEMKCWLIPRNWSYQLVLWTKEAGIALEIDKQMQVDFGLSRRGKTAEEIEERKRKKAADPSYAVDAEYDTKYLNLREGFDLYPYQRAGLKYMVMKDGRVLLGDDMGLGKTPQGIAMARHYQNDWPLVVIAPASLLLNWKKEIMQWLPDIKDEDIRVIKKGTQKPSRKITIASYDYTIKQEQAIKDYLGVKGVLLIDEAHNMKNPEAKRTEALMRICHVVKRLAVITGTPFLSRPKEAWSLLNAVNPFHPEWKDQQEFEAKYCEGKVVKMGKRHIYQANGAARVEEFHDLIREEVMIRRLKTDGGVLDQLPDKRRVTQYLEIDDEDRASVDMVTQNITYRVLKNYKNYKNNLRELKKVFLAESTAEGAEDDMFKAYKMTGMAKINNICDWVSQKLDDSDAKFIIFGHHKDFLNGISETLEKKKIKYMKIDGSTSKEKRFENTESFQKDPEIRVAVLSIVAASVGLTLTAASEVVMGEFPWTPALAQQAECRAHRNGQKELVTCYYMVANNTIDGYLWNMLSRKSVTSSLMLDGGEGDEMEEEIDMETGDLLDSIILSVHEAVQNGIIDINDLPDSEDDSFSDNFSSIVQKLTNGITI
jgi:SWI/SNF-related matrix-associated actin-dependent regulator 1 of chromatin subfamily A